MSINNTNHPASIHQKVSTNIVNNSGTINVSRYLELNSSPTDEDDSLLLLGKTNLHTTNEDAEHSNQDSNESSNPHETTNTGNLQNPNAPVASSFRTGSGSPILLHPYGAHYGPKYTFRVPHESEKPTSVVTPQAKQQATLDNPSEGLRTPTDQIPTVNDYTNDATQNSNVKCSTNDKYQHIYHSALLHKDFRPKTENIKLPPELEPLQPIILSQHEGFTQHIIDLGHISLTLTKIIEHKKESLLKLKHSKIQQSLQIKCELTTSSACTDNPEFLTFK
jgi:hypothetical protein